MRANLLQSWKLVVQSVEDGERARDFACDQLLNVIVIQHHAVLPELASSVSLFIVLLVNKPRI